MLYVCTLPPLSLSSSPVTSLKLLSANTLSSLLPFLTLAFPSILFLSFSSFSPLFLSPLSPPSFSPFSLSLCGSWALQEFLPSSSPVIDSLLSQSLCFLLSGAPFDLLHFHVFTPNAMGMPYMQDFINTNVLNSFYYRGGSFLFISRLFNTVGPNPCQWEAMSE